DAERAPGDDGEARLRELGPEVRRDALTVGRRRARTDDGDRATIECVAVEGAADPQARWCRSAEVVEASGPAGLSRPLEVPPEPREEIQHGSRIGVVDPSPPPGERSLHGVAIENSGKSAELGEQCGW